jgi:hypothetical protein
MDRYEASLLRIPKAVDRASMSSSVESIVESLANVVAPDRDGHILENLSFRPGANHLREVEKAVSFMAARLGAAGFTCFDVCGLIFALRDVLCEHLHGPAETEMLGYMEWLAVLAADSLATGREQAALERWHNELDEGTPLVMVTPELPAALFVCKPDSRVAAGVLGRLLLSVVRTGARAAIIDVSGISGRLEVAFADALERFLSHSKVAGTVTVFARGVHANDVSSWEDIANRSGAKIIFEDYFDVCVAESLKIGSWRLLRSS